MASLIQIPTIEDSRGSLSIIEEGLGFTIKRVFYIYDTPQNSCRGGHAHIKTRMALICLNGHCDVHVYQNNTKQTYKLDRPNLCLLLNPEDWHTMENFSVNSTLLVLASEKYDPNDYITERTT